MDNTADYNYTSDDLALFTRLHNLENEYEQSLLQSQKKLLDMQESIKQQKKFYETQLQELSAEMARSSAEAEEKIQQLLEAERAYTEQFA